MKTQLIKNARECRKTVQRLLNEPFIGLDLEGTNLGLNGSISLIHVSTEDGFVYIFDVIQPSDDNLVQELRYLLDSPNLVKVVHDGRNDAANIFSEYGIILENVFDTQIAEVFIRSNYEGAPVETNIFPGLNKLCQKYGVKENKLKDRFKGVYRRYPDFWNIRPLTSDMIEYVAFDVFCLTKLYLMLKSQIESYHYEQLLKLTQLRIHTATISSLLVIDVIRTFETASIEILPSPRSNSVRDFLMAQERLFVRCKFDEIGFTQVIVFSTFDGYVFICDMENVNFMAEFVADIFQSENILKYMHDSRHTVFSLYRDFGIKLCHVFDIQLEFRARNKSKRDKKFTDVDFLNHCQLYKIFLRKEIANGIMAQLCCKKNFCSEPHGPKSYKLPNELSQAWVKRPINLDVQTYCAIEVILLVKLHFHPSVSSVTSTVPDFLDRCERRIQSQLEKFT